MHTSAMSPLAQCVCFQKQTPIRNLSYAICVTVAAALRSTGVAAYAARVCVCVSRNTRPYAICVSAAAALRCIGVHLVVVSCREL